jgi:hypothetical protein
MGLSALGQRFDIRAVELEGERVNIYYDLVDPNPANTYTVSLFTSKDNFISAVGKVSGDIGLEVRPGNNKKITWSAKEELGPDFEGKVALEVRGRIYIPFIKLDALQKNFKRGKPTEISWTGGTSQNVLNFELYKGKEKIESYPPVPNVKHSSFTISPSVKPGQGYHFKISDNKNKDDVVLSPEFSVSRKVPLGIKAASGAALAAVIYIVIDSLKPKNNDIPDPLSPDTIN